jgi:hypothetical protein
MCEAAKVLSSIVEPRRRRGGDESPSQGDYMGVLKLTEKRRRDVI